MIFLLAVITLGGGITLYKKSHPHFAPGLILDQAEKTSMNLIPQETFKSKKPMINHKININIASDKELQNLPGIGPVLAKRIVTLREIKGGKFENVDELLGVKGIGSKKLEEIREWIVID